MYENGRCKEEDNNGVARAPPTCNQTNAREVGPVAKEITNGMVWWGGEKGLVLVSCLDLFWKMLC